MQNPYNIPRSHKKNAHIEWYVRYAEKFLKF